MMLRSSVVTLLVIAGCGRTGLAEDAGSGDAGSAQCAAMSVAAADAELMRRWNVAVDAGTQTLDFHWSDVANFPHPTYRGGTALAYNEFSDVLTRFWGDASTVAWAGCYELFDRAYKSGPPVAAQKTVQLRPLTKELSTFSLVDAPRQAALVHACAVIGC